MPCPALAHPASISVSTDPGFVASAAVGYELYSGKTFALDLSLRAGGARIEGANMGMSSLNVGVNWY